MTFAVAVVASHRTTVAAASATATSTAASATTITIHAGLLLLTTILAPHRFVREALTGVKLLFLRREDEVTFAIATLQGLVGKVPIDICIVRRDVLTSGTLLTFPLYFWGSLRDNRRLVFATATIVVAHDRRWKILNLVL
jgi:hypothetical protein